MVKSEIFSRRDFIKVWSAGTVSFITACSPLARYFLKMSGESQIPGDQITPTLPSRKEGDAAGSAGGAKGPESGEVLQRAVIAEMVSSGPLVVFRINNEVGAYDLKTNKVGMLGIRGSNLALSGDGNLALVTEVNFSKRLYVYSGISPVAYDEQNRWIDLPEYSSAEGLSFSLNNRTLAFVLSKNSASNLCTVDAAGVDSVDFKCEAIAREFDGPFSWSRNSDYLAFTARAEDGNKQIFGLLVGSGDYEAVQYTSLGENYWPTWSPNGDRMAFIKRRDGIDSIFRLEHNCEKGATPTEGDICNPQVLVDNSEGEITGKPAWSPDGRFVAYPQVAGDGLRSIVAVEAFDPSNRVFIPLGTGRVSDLYWISVDRRAYRRGIILGNRGDGILMVDPDNGKSQMLLGFGEESKLTEKAKVDY